MASVKVLVFGSLNGALQPAFAKASSLHAKNNFSFAIVTGDLFGEEGDENTTALLNGDIKVPLPTYFTVGARPLPAAVVAKVEADEEICENLHFLGKRSTTKITEGVRIVALGGALDPAITGGTSKEQHLPLHTANDAKTLKGATKADILLTSVWPEGVCNGSQTALPPENKAAMSGSSTQEVAELCDALKPRYHFSPSPGDFFYEREPFFHPLREDAEESPLTRFISMAPYGNATKAKAMYAFTLSLADTSAADRPVGTTASPFAVARAPKRKPVDDGAGASYSRFSNGDGDDHGRARGRHSKRSKRQRSPPPGPDRCFFCLSNPNLSLHMVCTVGDESYLATAKGPLATPQTFSDRGLSFPGHIIITPLAHTPTIACGNGSGADGSAPPAESYSVEDARRTYAEMTRFRESLQAMVAGASSHKLGAVTWEISRARNIHCHWQFHPVPADLVQGGLLEAGFKVEAENLKYPALEERDPSFDEQQSGPLAGDFFRLWIWADNGDDRVKGKSLVMRLPDSSDPASPRFDLQYPRRVVAKLLSLEARYVWQDCAQTEEEETQDAERFRQAFREWDFTQPQEAETS